MAKCYVICGFLYNEEDAKTVLAELQTLARWGRHRDAQDDQLVKMSDVKSLVAEFYAEGRLK